MSSGGRKKNKGGIGLTEAVSTGLLIAAEELYRNSLRKKKRGGGAEEGVTDGGTLSVQDIMNGGKRRNGRRGGAIEGLDARDGALLTDAFGKSLTGGKKKRPGWTGGNIIFDGSDYDLSTTGKLDQLKVALKAKYNDSEYPGAEDKIDRDVKDSINDQNEFNNIIGNLDKLKHTPPPPPPTSPSSIKKCQVIVDCKPVTTSSGGKRKQKKRGGEGTQFNMEEIAREAELAAENHVGGRKRRRGRPCGSRSKKGGDNQPFKRNDTYDRDSYNGDISGNLAENFTKAGESGTPEDMIKALLKGEADVSATHIERNTDGGRKRRPGRPCKKGGAAFGDFVNAISGQAGAIGSVAGVNTTPEVNAAEPKPETFATVPGAKQDGGKKKKKTYRKKRGGNDEGFAEPAPELSATQEHPPATQEGGKKKKKKTYRKKRGGNQENVQEQVSGLSGLVKGLLSKIY